MNLIVLFLRLSFFLFFLQPQAIFSAAPAATIPSLPIGSQIENEGFLWKNNLIIQHGDASVSFEESHTKLYGSLSRFQKHLSSLTPKQNIGLVQGVILNPGCSPALKEIFKGLNHEDKIISQLLNGQEISEESFKNKEITDILKKNLERLQSRNACIASLEYIAKTGERTLRNFYVSREGKSPAAREGKSPAERFVIFLSEIGNELIQILQETAIFNEFDFITFHHLGEQDPKLSIKFDHFESRIRKFYLEVPSITQSTDHCKVEAFRLRTTQQDMEKEGKILSQKASAAITTFLQKSNLDESPSDLLKLCNVLVGVKEKRQNAVKTFKHQFCHSEQAMRYFLFSYITEFLQGLALTADGLLTLNLHSVRDPCKYCTNAMFLECYLGDKAVEGEKNLLGFFQKVYHNIPEKKNMPQVFILVSSQILESEGGIQRRLNLGRAYSSGETSITPILTTSDIRLFFRDNNNVAIPFESLSEPKSGEKKAGKDGKNEKKKELSSKGVDRTPASASPKLSQSASAKKGNRPVHQSIISSLSNTSSAPTSSSSTSSASSPSSSSSSFLSSSYSLSSSSSTKQVIAVRSQRLEGSRQQRLWSVSPPQLFLFAGDRPYYYLNAAQLLEYVTQVVGTSNQALVTTSAQMPLQQATFDLYGGNISIALYQTASHLTIRLNSDRRTPAGFQEQTLSIPNSLVASLLRRLSEGGILNRESKARQS